MKAVRALLVVASAFTVTAAFAQEAIIRPDFGAQLPPHSNTVSFRDGWREIGSRKVGATDTIPVRGLSHFTKVIFCAWGGPITIFDADIRFAKGGSQAVEVSAMIPAGTCTPAIKLAGAKMTEIKFVYEQSRPRTRLLVRAF